MIKLQQITTFDQLYKTHGAQTGNILVDAVVEGIIHSRIHETRELALLLDADDRMLSKAMELFVGIPLKEMILQWRARQVIDLLDDPSLSFEEVAHRVGFRSEHGMIAAIRKYFGTTPTIYRNGTINQNGSYPMNIDKSKLKQAQDNAKALHQRDWGTTSTAE